MFQLLAGAAVVGVGLEIGRRVAKNVLAPAWRDMMKEIKEEMATEEAAKSDVDELKDEFTNKVKDQS